MLQSNTEAKKYLIFWAISIRFYNQKIEKWAKC